LAIFTAPMHSIVRGRLPIFTISLLNSVLWGLIAAVIVTRLRWRWIAAIVIAIPILLYLGMTAAAMILERRAGPSPRVAQRFPTLHENDSARRVDALATALGADKTRASLNAYLSREIARGDDDIDEPPQDVQHDLLVHRWDLDALERQLLIGEAPQWAIDLNKDEQLSVLPHLRLQKMILVDALDGAQNGDFNLAWRRVDAARRLTEPLTRRPEVIAVLVAIASMENQLGAARKLDPPEHFPLLRFDPHARLTDAVEAETATRRIRAPWIIRPYVRLCVAEAAVDSVKAKRTIQNQRGCFFQAPPVKDEFLLVPFNPIGFISPLEASRFAARANRLLVDFDGTERVLAMKRGLSADGKAACGTWVADRTVLHLEPPLPPAPPALPTRHQIIARPAARASS
ncbi:MAG TPA: hypothetical protein VII12_14880, partial [Thermoanaerobaculia bacterium]